MIRRRDAALVSLGIALAFTPRLITNLLTRPEFVGWFNHSTYYWVQTRSLLQNGQLAYEDMPLLFVLYAGLAQATSWVGVPLDESVVIASRFVMAVTPALIPIAIYILARRANGDEDFRWPTWCLIIASGFLPLTYANMPETLQKNMMGLLLLSWTIVALFRWLAAKSSTSLVVTLLLAATIVLVHLGSALAVLLLVGGVILEFLFAAPSRRTSLRLLLVSMSIAAISLMGIAALYPSAMNRVYALSDAFVPESALNALAILVGLAVWLGVLWFAHRWLTRRLSCKDQVASQLMRIVFLWMGLLALPLWPGEIGMRLLLFIPLGLLVFLALLLSQVQNSRLLTATAAGVALVFFLTSVGEAVSMIMIYPNKHEILVELSSVRDKYNLGSNDLVVTPYGVNPTANWFLGTKASLLTAVKKNIFTHHDRVFVLNTLERPAPVLDPGDCKHVKSEDDRYWTTRHDSPVQDLVPDADYATFSFFRLESMPENWLFDDAGLWLGWGECGGAKMSDSIGWSSYVRSTRHQTYL